MQRADLANILSDFLVPLGFKKKGNWWARNRNEINTLVDLQKSQFGNQFYVNYGFVLNAVPLNGLRRHKYARIGSSNTAAMLRIHNLLDLDSDITDDTRKAELKRVIFRDLIPTVASVNSETDVLNYIRKLRTMNGVPLVVKRHFGIETE